MSSVVCLFINTEGLFSRTAASILFPESELTTWRCTIKHNNGFNGGLECTKDLQAESVDILKRGCNRLFQGTVVLLESML